MTYKTVSWPFGGATFRESDDLKRHREKKKMFVRDRIEMLIDPGTPLLELSTLAANQTYEGEVQLRVPIGQA